jgi:hypothetical protein
VTFGDLDPAERVAAAEAHLAQLELPPGSPQLGVETLQELRHLKLALADDDVSDEAFVELLTDWTQHLDTLDALTADAARFELRRYTQIVEGLRPAAQEEDA